MQLLSRLLDAVGVERKPDERLVGIELGIAGDAIEEFGGHDRLAGAGRGFEYQTSGTMAASPKRVEFGAEFVDRFVLKFLQLHKA